MSAYDSYLLAISGTNAIAAWGLSIALRSGQLSVGHAAFAGLAAYTSAYLTMHGYPVLVALLAGIAVAALAGAVFSVLTIRLSNLLFAISTLVFAQICIYGIQEMSFIGGSQGLVGFHVWVTWQIVAVAVVVALFVEIVLIRRSSWGLRIQLLAHDATLSDLSGRSSAVARVQAFALSTAAVGVAGILRAHLDGVVLPDNLGFQTAIVFVVYAVVGGSSSSIGPFIGAILLTQATERLKVGEFSSSVILGLLLLIVCLVRPNGIVSRRALRILPAASTRVEARDGLSAPGHAAEAVGVPTESRRT